MPRRPKPTALKILEGNPGKRKLNVYEPRPSRKIPPCPSFINEEGKKEWRRLAKPLVALGVLTEADTSVFAAYCQAYGRWKQAEEKLANSELVYATPSGYPMQNPYLNIATHNMTLLQKFASEFGLTPSARSKIIANVNSGKPGDEMEELLDG